MAVNRGDWLQHRIVDAAREALQIPPAAPRERHPRPARPPPGSLWVGSVRGSWGRGLIAEARAGGVFSLTHGWCSRGLVGSSQAHVAR
jgi:hypothetical protein